MPSFSGNFLAETKSIIDHIDVVAIEHLAETLASIRARSGRLFILGVGGSAGHASHAVNDFRKLCNFEAYAPTDNVSELTARANDEGWETTFAGWLEGSRIGPHDGVLVFSVGGGDQKALVSVNIIRALELSKTRGAAVCGILGRDGGYTKSVADSCVTIPPQFPEHVTAQTEGLCAVIWHLLVSHPLLQQKPTKWEFVASSEKKQQEG